MGWHGSRRCDTDDMHDDHSLAGQALRRWGARRRMHAHERLAALESVMLRATDGRRWGYVLMLALAGVIATVGLLQDSTAVVIGAMLIAPLMTPILGTAASIVMGWGRRLFRSALVVVASSMATVAVGWLITRLTPALSVTLPNEVIARTSPDVRDLIIAVAAGAAGAYATVRRDVAGALPGVAVAVALVPPLATVGVLLARDQPALAAGAALLFLTNLVGIVTAAIVVFIAAGLVPMTRLRAMRHAVAAGTIAAVLATLTLGVFLTTRLTATAAEARRLQTATRAVTTWLGDSTDQLGRIDLIGTQVRVGVTGPIAPPSSATLAAALEAALGEHLDVTVLWSPLEARTALPSAPSVSISALRHLVTQWLLDTVPDGNLQVTRIALQDDLVQISVSGTRAPQSTAGLTRRIEEALGFHPRVSLSWTLLTLPETSTATASDTATAAPAG